MSSSSRIAMSVLGLVLPIIGFEVRGKSSAEFFSNS